LRTTGGFVQFLCARSKTTKDALLALPWLDVDAARFRTLSALSLSEQQALEASNDTPFETFRQQYLSPNRL
jgi:glutamate--cysteine ligase